MAFINYVTRNIAAKIVYYGPGLSGKTTNLRYIYGNLEAQSRGDLICLETPTERTFFFDLLPVKAGIIEGFQVHFQLMTVPGQVFYEASRKSVIKGADGIVFVADSQIPLLDSDLESFDGLRRNIRDLDTDLEKMPLVFQYNKRDLDKLIPVKTFNSLLNPGERPWLEAVATRGEGVFETLREIARLIAPKLKHHIRESGRYEGPPRAEVEEGAARYMRDEPMTLSAREQEEPVRLRKIKFHSLRDVENEIDKLSEEFTR
jgi:GTPase SAR1 family protein